MPTPANFNGARRVIDVNDSAMLRIDRQSGLFQIVGDMPMPELPAGRRMGRGLYENIPGQAAAD